MRPWRPAAIVAIALLPGAATILLVALKLEAGLGDFVPALWNDQTGYWHEGLSFSERGFGAGYYAQDEVPAKIGFITAGVQGPAYAFVYGTLGAVFGWSLPAGAYFNLALLGLTLAGFAYLGRLQGPQLLLLAALAASFGPLLLYAPTSSQEALQQAIACGLALIFARLLESEEPPSVGARIGFLAFICAVSLSRFSWALLLIPFLLLVYRRAGGRDLLKLAAAAGGLIGAILLAFRAISSPGGNSVLDTLGSLPEDPGGTLREVGSDTVENLNRLIDPAYADVIAVPSAVDAAAAQAWVMIGLLAVALLVSTGAITHLRGVTEPGDPGARREWLFHAYNLGSVILASLALYLHPGYFRVLGANLLLSLLVMIRLRRTLPAAAVIAAGALALPSLIGMYEGWRPNFEFDLARLEREREAVAQELSYEEGTSSRWCNTVLLVGDYDYSVTLIPAGIGVSYIYGNDLTEADLPLRSRWVLLQKEWGQRSGALTLRPRLREVARLPAGRLFANPASECEEPAPR